jgi:hypothetical protein
MYSAPDIVDDGGLVSYGPIPQAVLRRADRVIE